MSGGAEEIIAALDLAPHPEGGWFREMFRDAAPSGERSASTAIYYRLKAGEASHWHRVDAVEIWHWYGGDPLDLAVSADGARVEHIRLGGDILAGERPQGVVPQRAWQSARPLGAWTLVGCTVAPAFEFAGFEMAPPEWQPGPPSTRR
jgi:predicted cupin superfamily sugar epimerase